MWHRKGETMAVVRFTIEDAQTAADVWGFNCGPAALCAMLEKTPDEIRPHLHGFDAKRYTNPTMMKTILDSLSVEYRQVYRSDTPVGMSECSWDFPALIRMQWGGRWTNAGVPMRVRQRCTHWIGWDPENEVGRVFDVNAMCVGGWIPFEEWYFRLVPWLISEACPKGDGTYWPTHVLEIIA